MPQPYIPREGWDEDLAELALMEFQDMQENILLIMAARLEEIRQLTPEELKSLVKSAALAAWINHDMALIRRAMNQMNRKYTPIVATIVNQLEGMNFRYMQPYLDYRHKQVTRTMYRAGMEKRIQAMQKEVVHGLLNLSHTYCYAYNGTVSPVGQVYRRIVNKGVESVALGVETFDKVMKRSMDDLAESGIKTLHWKDDEGKKKPVIRRADAHIRMNLMEGIFRINAAMQEEAGNVFGADGVEISMHHLCAPDHLHIQGRQYTADAYERLNERLKRPIGTLNCRHIAMPIIYGVSPAVHTDAEIAEARQNSTKIVKYNGREMTRYEASQKMRSMERDIRLMRSKLKAYKAAGLAQDARAMQNSIKDEITKYKGFCGAVGLTERLDRTKYYL